jgi:RNA methyltransferase, TrmH family
MKNIIIKKNNQNSDRTDRTQHSRNDDPTRKSQIHSDKTSANTARTTLNADVDSRKTGNRNYSTSRSQIKSSDQGNKFSHIRSEKPGRATDRQYQGNRSSRNTGRNSSAEGTGAGGVKSDMQDTLVRAGITLSENAVDQLWTYHNYLRDRNEELNLTRLYNFKTVVRKHYVDCLLPLNILKKHNIELQSPVMDMGSGAGFPGVPMAIARPDLQLILNDGRKVRVDFLNEVIRVADLKNATGLAKKISPGYENSVNAVITRAVDPMDESILRASHVLNEGGLFIFLKGPNCDDEIEAVNNLSGNPCTLILDEHYVLPESDDARRLVVWKYNHRIETDHSADERFKELPENSIFIESDQNAVYKTAKSLHSSRSIKKSGQALVCGKKIIHDLLLSQAVPIEALLYDEKADMDKISWDIAENSDITEIRKYIFKSNLFKEIDLLGTGSPLLLVNTPEIAQWDGSLKKGINLFLPLSDPENLGSALRSAAAFGVSQVILLSESAHPFHPKVIRTSAGSVFSLDIKDGPSIEDLKVNGDLLVLDGNSAGSDPNAVTIDKYKSSSVKSIALLVGLEGKGVPFQIRGQRLYIPIESEVESLNASVALGIALYMLQESYKNY